MTGPASDPAARHGAGPVTLVGATALGDGLLTLVLAENLRRAGRASTLYHTQLTELSAWFPHATIEALPGRDALADLMQETPALFVGDPGMIRRGVRGRPIPEGQQRLVFSKAHWTRSARYLASLAEDTSRAFDLPWVTEENGLTPPDGDRRATHPKRICLHPLSASAHKNWPAERFLELADLLADDGWEPVFLLAEDELAPWARQGGATHPAVAPGALDKVAAYLHASGAAIANDSGIGHLAANVGLPTLSIFRKRSASRFWAPSWGHTRVVTAPLRLPGAGGHRHWGRLLRPKRVFNAFRQVMRAASDASR